jgi:hypothetical protein
MPRNFVSAMNGPTGGELDKNIRGEWLSAPTYPTNRTLDPSKNISASRDGLRARLHPFPSVVLS